MFTKNEQEAILQCIWQLLSAKPSQEECKFVEHTISFGWECKCLPKPIENEITLDVMCGEIASMDYFDYPWIICAIECDPYRAFGLVAQLTLEKKKTFKQIVKSVVEHCDDVNYKTAMAVTLFQKTNIPFAIRGKDWLNDCHDGNQTII